MGEGTEDANADAGKPILLDGKGHEKKTQDSTGKSNAEAWGKKAGKKEACQKDPRCKKKGRPFRSVEVEDDDGHGIGKAQMGSRQRQQVATVDSANRRAMAAAKGSQAGSGRGR